MKQSSFESTRFPFRKSRFWKWDDGDQARLAFYGGLIPPNNLVFDVGANLGKRTKIFLELGARVVAFEPHDRCAASLAEALSDQLGFTLIERALGAGEGTTHLMIGEPCAHSTMSEEWIRAARKSGRLREWNWGTTQSVQVTTLERMVQELGRPDFINIDVEGYELEVLSGLSTPVPLVAVAFQCEFLDRAWRCIEQLASMDRRTLFQITVGEETEFDLTDWISGEIACATLADLVDADAMVRGSVFAKI